MHPNRKKSREDYGTFRSNQLRNKIFQLMTFIEGQYAGSFDDQDMHDGDFGHLARLVDMIDAYNMNNPDNKMDYPKIRDESMRPVDWAPYLVNESRAVRITKKQLRRIIKEEKQALLEMEDRYGGAQNYNEYWETVDKLLQLMQNMTPQGRSAVAGELLAGLMRY